MHVYTILCKAPTPYIARKCIDFLASAYPLHKFMRVSQSNHIVVTGDVSKSLKDDMQMICVGVGIQNDLQHV